MQNTFNQFDQFENVDISYSKNKHLFDFAHNSANENGGLNLNSVWIVKGQKNLTTNMTSFTGDTGLRPIAFGNPVSTNLYGPFFTGTTFTNGLSNGAQLTSSVGLTEDNSGYNQVPSINENILVFLRNSSPSNANESIFYRAGYIELSFRTSKSNCIIGYGSGSIRLQSGTIFVQTSTPLNLESIVNDPTTGNISGTQYATDTEFSNVNELSINIKNGKLNISYNDLYGINANSFEINSNTTVNDNQWHHVVINFGRPGLIKDHANKSEEKTIEIWIDGKLDKRTSEYTENDQIFFPEINWLCANPNKLIEGGLNKLYNDGFNSQDDLTRTLSSSKVWSGEWSTEAELDAFAGAIRTFAHGINIPLSKFEIQERYKFWNYNETPFRDSLDASATLINPTVSVNKKRALKLYWNNISRKNGIELDDNFIVESYSITHKNKNSVTETFNLDLAKRKDFNLLTNVRVALKDNILIWAPGNVSPNNISTSSITGQKDPNHISQQTGFTGSFTNMTFSGVELNNGDRILLTNQVNKAENGIWIFNGKTSPLTRPSDADSPTKINNAIVYVTEGTYKETYWTLEANVGSFEQAQKWIKLESKPDTTINVQPLFTGRWSDSIGNSRFISLQNDINIGNYDLIVFMNYPDNLTELKDAMPTEDVTKLYKEFVASVKQVVVEGASLYVSSPMLAIDLGIVNHFHEVPQLLETTDAQSAAINPFQIGEPAEKYFDTHRNNQYSLAESVVGLTDKDTYLLTDFINYVPDNAYDYEQYHAKYVRRQTGIQEGNTWFIPGLALTKFTENENLPGDRNNYRGTKPMLAPEATMNINSGTIVAKFANNYYNGSTVTSNPYDDYAAIIAVLPGQNLGGTGITGKIFVNVVEDGYAFSREDYNKAYIQILPETDINETTNTRLWQYSTNRLNRTPRRINISGLTEYGQTVPTNGGGGGFIQAASNASSGIIRSESDSSNNDFESDFYPTIEEEIYPLQEIPVYSMTWLGLQWLAG
jgi:hypothetical protein